MALMKADPVAAARKALEDAEAAATTEGKRLAKAIEAADKYAGEAAGIDPDADAKAFERATAKLGELRATIEIVRTREAGAKAKADAARGALATAENAARRAQLEAINADVKAREAAALGTLRVAFDAFAEEVATIARDVGRAHALEAQLKAAGVADLRAFRATTAGWAGAPPLRIAQLAAESALHGVRFH